MSRDPDRPASPLDGLRAYEREAAKAARHPLPAVRDWALLAISVVFVAAGLFILPRDPNVGIVTLAFFGSCLAVFAAIIVRKLRVRRFTGETIEVVGGVPIRPQRWRILLLGGWLLALGTILLVFAKDPPDLIWWLAAFIAAVGASVMAGVLTGRLPGGYLQFDPEGFTIANRQWRAVIPWDQIASVNEGELADNPILLISVHDLAAVTITPPDAIANAAKTIARYEATYGANFMIMTTHYGIDLPVLTATIVRYATDPAARKELCRRSLPKVSPHAR